MAIRKKTALRYQQPYDSTLKALFEANTADMLSFVILRQTAPLIENQAALVRFVSHSYKNGNSRR